MKSSISTKLLEGAEQTICQRAGYKDYIVAALFLISAVALVFVLTKLDLKENSALYFTLWLAVVTATIVGIVKLFTAKKVYFVEATQSPLSQYVLYFEGLSPEELERQLKASNCEKLKKYFCNSEKSLKMELLTSADRNFSKCLIYKFIPYNYEPVSEVMTLPQDVVIAILSMQK